MRDWDIQVLFHFIRRPGMYTGSFKANDYKSIDSFLIAYEMGAMGECKFRARLIKQIEDKYNVQFPSEGLVKQLRTASKIANQEIREFFINESMEILIAASDQNNQTRFVNYKRKQLVNRLEQFPEKININWVSNFSREIRELKAWKGINLTNDEMNRSERLIDDINLLIKDDVMKLVEVTNHINGLKSELLGILKTYILEEG